MVNDKYASTPFLICTRLGAVNDKYAGYWVWIRHSVMHICHWPWSMTNMQATVSKSDTVFNAHLSLTMVNDKYALTESKSHTVFVHICHWLRSMTNMQVTVSKSHSVSMHICHWPWSMTNVHLLTLNHTHFHCIFVIDCGQWQKCFDTFYDLHPLKSGQWQICRIVSLNHTQFQCIFVIDYGQWQICTHWV